MMEERWLQLHYYIPHSPKPKLQVRRRRRRRRKPKLQKIKTLNTQNPLNVEYVNKSGICSNQTNCQDTMNFIERGGVGKCGILVIG